MDDEFALCWNNFQDNIASGFQNLYDRGDLVDVTLACDGRLLHAHKIVLAICSPYFQEIFISNPCKHPIIILKDVTHGVMCELLQFMYQGVVNVKHTELQSFMKIAQLLQIKGLASGAPAPSKSPSQQQTTSSASAVQNTSTSSTSGSVSGGGGMAGGGQNQSHKHSSGLSTSESNNQNDSKNNIPAPSSSSSTSSPSPMPFSHIKSPQENLNPFQTGPGLKRLPEYSTESLSIYSRKQYRRNTDSSEHDMCPDSMDHVNPDDNFLPSIPHISMAERFDPNSVKRENNDHTSSPLGLRNALPPHFGFDYNIYKNNPDYPSDLHLPNDYSKSFGNHMDIPPIAPGERWFHGKLEFMLSQRGKPLLVHDGHTFGIQYVRKDKKYWQCNLSRKFNCKARVTTTDTGEIIVTNNEHCHTEIRQHLRKDYQRNKVMMNAFINLSKSHLNELHRHQQQNANNNLNNFGNINNLSTSSSSSSRLQVDKEYRPYLDMTQEAINASMAELGKASSSRSTPSSPGVEKVDSNMNTKNVTDDDDGPIDVSWKGKANDST